jgi:sec-independent protein translocase protein TatC
MLLMAVPLIILYEVGILGARIFGRKPLPEEAEVAGSHLDGLVPTGTAGKRVK